jgi:hypothetical protein
MRKIKYFLFLLIIFFLTENLYSWDSTTAKLFPLAVGNTWFYHSVTYGPANCITIVSQSNYSKTITGVSLMSNGKWYYSFDNGLYYRIDSTNMNVYKYNGGTECMVDSLFARINDSYFSCWNTFMTLLVQDTNSVVAWGTLRRAKRLYYNPFVYTRRLIEGIGIFSEEMCSSTGRYKSELTGCIINGIQYGNVGITQTSIDIPNSYSLSQNYPNPFNPTTKIKFDIPSNVKNQMTNVKIIIYDLLGREVSTLVNEQLKPGTYEVEWPAPPGDGSNFSSGIYYYKLIAGDFILTRKMVLVK